MTRMFLTAYRQLVLFDRYVTRGDFSTLYQRVQQCPVESGRFAADMRERVLAAIDLASIWYWKEVLCLQRSAATTCLLRRYGVPAQMVIGAQRLPFHAHAWVEVEGIVVNDRTYTPETYRVLERC